jgi:basic membrane protein A
MKKIKKIATLLLIIALLFIMLACSKTGDIEQSVDPAEGTASSEATDSSPKCAFLIPGPITDMSWCYNEYLGYEMVVDAGYEATYLENVTPNMLVDSVRTYASEGYNCIIIGTDANQEDVIETAKDFPDCHIFIANCAYVTENVSPIFFADEDQGFAMGVIAGLATKKNKVAYIAGIDFVPLTNGGKGFVAGVKHVNPTCEVAVKIAGTTEDVAMMKEFAKKLYEMGYDVIAPNADQAGLGVMEAAAEIEGAIAIAGSDGMIASAPNNAIASVNLLTYVGYYAAFMDYVNGTIPKEATKYGMKAGLVELPSWNENFFEPFTEDQRSLVSAAYEAYKKGDVVVDLSEELNFD